MLPLLVTSKLLYLSVITILCWDQQQWLALILWQSKVNYSMMQPLFPKWTLRALVTPKCCKVLIYLIISPVNRILWVRPHLTSICFWINLFKLRRLIKRIRRTRERKYLNRLKSLLISKILETIHQMSRKLAKQLKNKKNREQQLVFTPQHFNHQPNKKRNSRKR